MTQSPFPQTSGIDSPARRRILADWRRQAARNLAAQNNRQYVSGAKLTPSEVLEIRARGDAGGEVLAEIASDYGISESQVSRIVRGDAWAHLPKRAL